MKLATQIIEAKLYTSLGIFHANSLSGCEPHLTSPPSLPCISRPPARLACEEPQAPAHQHECPATITGLLRSRAHRRPALPSTVPSTIILAALHSPHPVRLASRYCLSTATTLDEPRHAHALRPSRGLLPHLVVRREAPSTRIEDTPRHYRTRWLRPRNHRGRAGAPPVAPQGAAAAGGRT